MRKQCCHRLREYDVLQDVHTCNKNWQDHQINCHIFQNQLISLRV